MTTLSISKIPNMNFFLLFISMGKSLIGSLKRENTVKPLMN